jgi:transcriptional regulator with XRE-family HTH domain
LANVKPPKVKLNCEALTAIRTKDGQSMAQLARAAGMSRQNLSEIEKGHRGTSGVTRKRLAMALNVPVSAIEAQIIEARAEGDAA